MLTQFYGTVNPKNAPSFVDDGVAQSNNFSVSYVEPGHTTVTLNQWVAYQPCVAVTPQLYSVAPVTPTSASHQISLNGDQKYQIDIYTTYTSEGVTYAADVPYSFALVCGAQLYTDLEPGAKLALSARIIDSGGPVLVLSTSCNGTTCDLDVGTVLTATTLDPSVTMTIPPTVTGGDGTIYSLAGYTYSAGLSEPTFWVENAYTVVVPEDTGISSPFLRFRTTATAPGGLVLTGDPMAIVKKRGS